MRYRHRSAISGRFVTAAYARPQPAHHDPGEGAQARPQPAPAGAWPSRDHRTLGEIDRLNAMHALLDAVLLDLKRPPAPNADPRVVRALEVVIATLRDEINRRAHSEIATPRGDRP